MHVVVYTKERAIGAGVFSFAEHQISVSALAPDSYVCVRRTLGNFQRNARTSAAGAEPSVAAGLRISPAFVPRSHSHSPQLRIASGSSQKRTVLRTAFQQFVSFTFRRDAHAVVIRSRRASHVAALCDGVMVHPGARVILITL